MLSVILWPEEGDFPENLHHVVYVIINKHSFESFVFGSCVTKLKYWNYFGFYSMTSSESLKLFAAKCGINYNGALHTILSAL